MINRYVVENYLSATSLKNYINNDPILDYFKWMGLKGESMNSYLKSMSDRGITHEDNINQKIVNYCRYNNISCIDLSNVDFSEKFSNTMESLNNGIDVIIQGMVISSRYPLYGCPDIIIKRKYLNLLDSIDRECSAIGRIIDDQYCIVEIKSCTVYSVDNQVINRNFKSHESQAYIYSLCLSDMIWYISGIYYFPRAYLHVKKIWRTYGKSSLIPKNVQKMRRIIEIDYSIHDDVIRGIYWMKTIDKSRIGLDLFPNPDNTHDHPYRMMKTMTALIIGDIAYLPGSSVDVRKHMINKGIYSIYDDKLNVDELNVDPVYKENIRRIVRCNKFGESYYRQIDLQKGIFMYIIGKRQCLFLINGRLFKRIPVWCKYSVIYYYSCTNPPKLPDKFRVVNLKDIMESNGIVMRGMINFSLQSVSMAMYINGLYTESPSKLIYTCSPEDIYIIQEIYRYITKS